MRRHIWNISKQLFIPFVLLELFVIFSTVNARVIRREITEHNNTTREITTEGAATTNIVTSIPSSSSSSSHPAVESTTLTIARVTANDIIRRTRKKSQESTTLEAVNESTTEEAVVDILNVTKQTNQTTEKLVRTGVITTTQQGIIEESTTAAAIDVPTTKDSSNAKSNKNVEWTPTDKVSATEVITENEEKTTSTELPKLNYNKHTFSDSNSTSENSNSTLEKVAKTQDILESPEYTTVDYEKQFEEIVLTTPQSIHDFKPKLHHHEDEEEISTTPEQTKSDHETTTESVQIDLDKINKNSTNEKNTTILVNTSVVESTNYDIATNEIKNSTIPVKLGEKRSKQLKDSNMTLPDAPEVWALAGMKNIESTKEIDGKLVNVTVEDNSLPEVNSTGSTKLLVDWSQIVKEVEFNNKSIKNSPNSIENALESSNDKLKETNQKVREQLEQENQVISVAVNPLINDVNKTSGTTSVPSTSQPIVSEENDKTTPSIENNQVEDSESDYLKNKKIKATKDSGRNGSIKEELNKISLPSTTEQILITKKSTTTVTSSTVPKISQSIIEPPPATTTTIQPEVIETIKKITTSSTLLNLIDRSGLTTSTDRNVINEISPSSSSTTSARSTLSTLSTTEESKYQTETTTEQRQSVSTTTVSENSSSDGPSTTEAEMAVESSSSYSPISEPSITEPYTDLTSTTNGIPSTTAIGTQMKPVPDEIQSSSTTTEEYFKSTTESDIVSDYSTPGTRFSSTQNNVIERMVESTTTGIDDQFTSETSKMSTTTFISSPGRYDSIPGFMNGTEEISTTTIFQNTPTKPEPHFVEPTKSPIIPKQAETTTTEQPMSTTTHDPQVGGMIPPDNNSMPNDTDYNVIIAISVSVVGIIALILLVGFLYVMRKRQKNLTYGQRCRPVSLDAYSLDNVSIYNSVRRKGALRASKRSYGNVAFDDPSLKHNVLNVHDLAKFVDKKSTIYEEFKDVPQIIARPDEVPQGCEDKNRYANVIPLPETRVILQQLNGDEKTEYINANYVRGPKDPPNYYIACQAPLESTVADFWRMIWEQNSRVIIMATDLVENGKEKCAEYLPPSITIDNHVVYGDFQITLKNREVKEKYAVSTLHIKNNSTNTWREITHFWYQWPETGVPNDEAGVIAMLLEARSCLKMATQEQADEEETKTNGNLPEANGNVDKTKSVSKTQGPLTVHCSPGTGRTGTIIACDIALRSLETPKRSVDIPQIVYYVRRGRASAVQTKEQYELIYRVAHMYATKISGPINET